MKILEKAVHLIKKAWKDYLWMTIGCIISALAINIFLVPYKIAPGGVTGLATVIYYVIDGKIPVGTIMLFLNIPLFILGVRFIGRKFILRTLYSTIMLSLIIDLTEGFTQNLINIYLIKFDSSFSQPDLLLYALFGGFLLGIGLGLVFRVGATTGGSDLAAKIVNYFITGVSMGKILLVIDVSIIIVAAVAFKSVKLALYAMASMYITSKLIDTILEGFNYAKGIFIISDKSEEISEAILKQIDRGVTGLNGKGMYSGTDKQVLLCVVNRSQIKAVKDTVKKIDEKAFVILTEVREVLGEGFQAYE